MAPVTRRRSRPRRKKGSRTGDGMPFDAVSVLDESVAADESDRSRRPARLLPDGLQGMYYLG